MGLVLSLFALGIIVPTLVFAAFGASVSFGGRVTATPAVSSSTVTCTDGYGPLTISPTKGPYGLYLIKNVTSMPTTGDWILGLYNPVIDMSSCSNTETHAPVGVYDITYYGTS